ncbi:MAG: capsule biosynthesis protein [Pseudomonadota bacterium]
MTTKPTAKRFRIRKSSGPRADEASAQPTAAEAPTEPSSAMPHPPGTGEDGGYTVRELRMARRKAQRMGLSVSSDLEAVDALREKGIDPFNKGTGLQLVDGATDDPQTPAPFSSDTLDLEGPAKQAAPVPASTPKPRKSPPAPKPMELPAGPALATAPEVAEIQKDIVRRRKRALRSLVIRLAAFVFVPTLMAFLYFAYVATPMYSTRSEFLIQQPEAAGGTGLGGLLSGTGFANSQDSIAVQSYLLSREAMLRLDAEHDFRAHFSDPDIDAIQRLAPDASNEDMYGLYKRLVTIGYDPTEGIIRMDVVAASPEASVTYAKALIAYAEEQVDQLTQRIRSDQMQGARESYVDAEQKMRDAQQRVLELQEQRGVLSAEAEVTSLMNQISTFEVELKQERLALQSLLDNAQPNAAKVAAAEANISRLTALIAEMRSEMTEGTGGSASLARITGELVIAEADLQTRQLMLGQALQQLETARIEANRQVRYLLQGVRPTATDEPSYPRVFENTLLAFLTFAGIYLMLSLTVSILREQVSN